MPFSNKKDGKYWTKEADKALRDGFESGLIVPSFTAKDAYKLHDAFEEPGFDVFRRHYYNIRKQYRAKNDKNANVPQPTSKYVAMLLRYVTISI